MSEKDENILCSLLALGFEHEDCVNVIQNGVRNVEDAVDILVNGRGGRGMDMDGKIDIPSSASSGISSATCQGTDFTQRNQQLKDSYNEQLRKRKKEESNVRERVIQNFKADRMRQKDTKILRNCSGQGTGASPSASGGAAATDGEHETRIEKRGRIRVRLPNGENIQLSLTKESLLQEVLDTVLQSVEDTSLLYRLMQPFPRREYNRENLQMSLEALHLFPSASLVLHVLLQQEEDIEVQSDASALPDEDMSDEAARHGCGESRLLAGNIDNEINDMEVDDAHAEASHIHHVRRHIDNLQLLAAKAVAHNLTVLETKTVNGMAALSSKSAMLVIDVLKSWKMLSPKLMSMFIPCRLKEMHLDSYGLAANELLEKLRFHKTITVLSLKSCHLLNDHAVSSCLQRLRGIKFLNLGDCCRLTGNVLHNLLDLAPLEVLILDKLKISDENVNNFLKSHQLEKLKKLSFDYCPISSLAFMDVKMCSSLVSLSLNNTQVVELSFVQFFPNLVKLDLQNTHIIDLELGHVRKLDHLKSLKLRGTSISGDGLWYLNGMQLTYLNTADRQTVTNETIAMLSAFPLHTLDLSDHIHLTDTCIPSIAKMVTLTSISLSNTKITDDKLLLLVELHDLVELDVSKTVVTNHATALMTQLPLLHTINLAWTKVDDDCFVGIIPCLQLAKLNLSHTAVTDKGIMKLRSESLQTLILDATGVTWRGAEVCYRGCPQLKLLRNNETRVLINR